METILIVQGKETSLNQSTRNEDREEEISETKVDY